MGQKQVAWPRLAARAGMWLLTGFLAVLVGWLIYSGASLAYAESKGPFKNWTQVIDLNGDGNLDVLVSHTRWEQVDESWAGVGRWINQGNGQFKLVREQGTEYFAGFAGAAGDIDQDGDADVFVQNFGIRLLVNQGGAQGGKPGEFMSSGGINSPPAYNLGYRDMGGTITVGDLNGDGRLDAFIAGCCYGMNAARPGNDHPNAPSASWVWINDGRDQFLQGGHILPLDFLDGLPLRQAALGDLDGDGDLDIFAAVGKPTMGVLAALGGLAAPGLADEPGSLVLLNDGTGSLAPYRLQPEGPDSASIALGDVNGDGRLDALVGTDSGARLWINQGDEIDSGAPVFAPSAQGFEAVQTGKEKLQRWLSTAAGQLLGLYLPYGSVRARQVFLADLDGDGDLDALLARVWGAEIWWNDGQGNFRRSDLRLAYQEDTGVAVGDFDRDGDLDIFAAGNGEGYKVWRNDGKGNFGF